MKTNNLNSSTDKVRSDRTVVFYVYILRCRNDIFYTGYTNNIERRLAEHNRGTASKFTRSRLPVILAYVEKVDKRALAMKREISIKRLPRVKKIEFCRLYEKRK